MDLVRDIDRSKPKQVIVDGIVAMARRLDIQVLAEGIETAAERDTLRAAGIDLMQGFLFSKPAFKALGSIAAEAWG
jgi:EAL domain-containing protein (putative c-di-GMP-specific phosphodiesterase class I)